MRVARYYGRLDLRIEDVEEPQPGPNQVKVRVLFNGLCGTDVHEYFEGPSSTRTEPHPLTGVKNPVVLGHEFSGRVVQCGPGVTDLEGGELVSIEPLVTCGRCPYCTTGHRNLCQTLGGHGFNTRWGGLGEFTVVERSQVHVAPDGCSPLGAALVEPLAVGYHAARLAAVEHGQVAVVHGGGPIGLSVALALRARDVTVVVSEPSLQRRDIFTNLGFEYVIDARSEDLQDIVGTLTSGAGAEATFDAAGTPAALTAAIDTASKRGAVVIVAKHSKPLLVAPELLYGTERKIMGSVAYGSGDFAAVLSAVAAGSYPLEGWFSTTPFDYTIIDQGFEVLRTQKAMKVLVRVNTEAPVSDASPAR